MKSEFLFPKKCFDLIGKYWKFSVIKELVFKWQVKVIHSLKQNIQILTMLSEFLFRYFGPVKCFIALFLYHRGSENSIAWKDNIFVSPGMHFLLPTAKPHTTTLSLTKHQTPACSSSFEINLDLAAHLSDCPRGACVKICKVEMAWFNLEWLNRKCFPKPNVFKAFHVMYRLINKVQMG